MSRIRSALVIAALALAGCGGDDDGAGGRLSKDDFVSQASQICRDGSKAADEFIKKELAKPEVSKLPTDQQAARVFEASQGLVDQTLRKVEALKPPEDLEDDVDRMAKDVRQTMQLITEIPKADQDRREQIVQEIGELAASSREAAAKAGLTDCLPETARSAS